MRTGEGDGPGPGGGHEPLVAGSPPDEDEETVTESEYAPCLLRYITLISRLFGIITLAILWALTILTLQELKKYNPYVPWYLLAISFLLTFFELNWLFNKCVTCRVGFKEGKGESMSLTYDEIDLSRREGCCCRCWRIIVWVDNWRKALVYVAFALPMFIHQLVTVYSVICGLFLLILAAFYSVKSFKDSKCVARKTKKHSYVQTTSTHKPRYSSYPVQTQSAEYPPASHGYDSLGHTNSVQPPEYSELDGPRKRPVTGPDAENTNYFRPFKDGVGNVPDEPKATKSSQSSVESKSPKQERKPPPAKQNTVTEQLSAKSESPPADAVSKDPEKSSPKAGAEKAKVAGTPDEGGFKLFGLRKKEEKPREAVVTMVSSERAEEEDLEQYPEDKNPFDEDDDDNCEWDPNNRGQS